MNEIECVKDTVISIFANLFNERKLYTLTIKGVPISTMLLIEKEIDFIRRELL